LDKHNDDSWTCTFGTTEDDGIWLNVTDRAGMLMATMVWILFLYSAFTILLLAEHHHCPQTIAYLYCTLTALALASHIKTSWTDPGTIPSSAAPIRTDLQFHTMCSLCHTYKPEHAHHCRICNRCVSKMDHHCPWMNNCVGAANLKHFILFLIYTWTACLLAFLLFSVNYFFCSSDNCEFSGLEVQLVRAMAWLCVGALLFTTSMLVSVVYGILTGVGTIDRLKRKAGDVWHDATDEPTPLKDIFGIHIWAWWLPIDPVFDDYDRIMGYVSLTRLLRNEASYDEENQQRF
jgi:hypothetical protein